MKEYVNQIFVDAEEDESPMLRHVVGNCPVPPDRTLTTLGRFAQKTIKYALGCCTHLWVVPEKLGDKGKMPCGEWIDESRLVKVAKRKIVKLKLAKNPGGPSSTPPSCADGR